MLHLEAGQWWGWSEQPFRIPGWGASPIFLCDVKPRGNGLNELHLRFIEVLVPHCPAHRTLVLRIQLHRSELIVGTYRDLDGSLRVATIASCTADWLSASCPRLLAARSPAWPMFGPSAVWSAADYLRGLFGATESEIGDFALRAYAATELPPPPVSMRTVPFDRTLTPWESRLLAMGCRPASMDDRWWVYLDGDALLLRRSWTRFLILSAETRWIDDRLRIETVAISQDVSQYIGFSDQEGLEQFRSVLHHSLLGWSSLDGP